MREIRIEKVVLNCGAIGDKLDKACRLLKVITGKEPKKTQTRKRIPAFNIRPGLEIGCKVTIRKNTENLLKRLLAAVNNQLKEKQLAENHFSFGISEYIEIPEVEYQRDIGIFGLDVDVIFSRKGKRVMRRKLKKGKIPKKQNINKEEIKEFMIKNFNAEIK